jgi:hypothetical protein
VGEQSSWNPWDQQIPNQWQRTSLYQDQPYQGQPDPGQSLYGPSVGEPPHRDPGYRPPPQPHRPPPRGNSHWVRNILSGVGALVVAIVLIYIFSSRGGSGASSDSHASSASAHHWITYTVTGTRGADVSYGPSGTEMSAMVPMKVTVPLQGALFYTITAQLNGHGKAACAISVDGKVIDRAKATGGHHIAQCGIDRNQGTGTWQSVRG